MDGIPTGVDFIDSGADGFYRSKPYLVFGASGTGKSIMGLQYVTAGLERGEGALYVCRERAKDLIQQAERLGFPLTRYADDETLVLLEYDDGFRDVVTRNGPEVVLEELTSQVDSEAIRRVVFDPVDPFFSSLDDEAVLRTQMRSLTAHFETLGWTPLLLCDDTAVSQQPFVLRVFAEVCWGLFGLERDGEGEGPDHSLLVYKMRNVDLPKSRFEFRIGEGGISSMEAPQPSQGRRPSFARFRPEGSSRGDAEVPEHRSEAENAPPPVEPPPASEAGLPELDSATGEATLPAVDTDEDGEDLLDDEALDQLEQLAAAKKRAARKGVKPNGAPVQGRTTRKKALQAKPPAAPKRPSALVIDPDPEARAAITRQLEPEMEVFDAPDGVVGLRSAAAVKPDILISSSAMPRLNGIGLCRILREFGADVPILFLCSSHARSGERVRCLMAGGDEAISKPLEPDLLRRRPPGTSFWPEIDLDNAAKRLLPRRIPKEDIEGAIAEARSCARDSSIPLCLLSYDFRFVDEDGVYPFVDRFYEELCHHVRAEDSLCRLGEKRIIAILVDADDDGARAVVRRLHQGMSEEAANFVGKQPVKPKALYRMLTLQSDLLAGEKIEPPVVEHLFRQPPHLIEEDAPERPGDPVEKFPLLEAVFSALTSDVCRVMSPLDGSSHQIETDTENRVRAVSIDGYRYQTQDASEETPAGFRARLGSQIVWVQRQSPLRRSWPGSRKAGCSGDGKCEGGGLPRTGRRAGAHHLRLRRRRGFARRPAAEGARALLERRLRRIPVPLPGHSRAAVRRPRVAPRVRPRAPVGWSGDRCDRGVRVGALQGPERRRDPSLSGPGSPLPRPLGESRRPLRHGAPVSRGGRGRHRRGGRGDASRGEERAGGALAGARPRTASAGSRSAHGSRCRVDRPGRIRRR